MSSRNACFKDSLVRDQLFWNCICFSVFVVPSKAFCGRRKLFSLQFCFQLKNRKQQTDNHRDSLLLPGNVWVFLMILSTVTMTMEAIYYCLGTFGFTIALLREKNMNEVDWSLSLLYIIVLLILLFQEKMEVETKIRQLPVQAITFWRSSGDRSHSNITISNGPFAFSFGKNCWIFDG